MITGRDLINILEEEKYFSDMEDYYDSERLYSDSEVEELLERAYSEGYWEGQKEFGAKWWEATKRFFKRKPKVPKGLRLTTEDLKAAYKNEVSKKEAAEGNLKYLEDTYRDLTGSGTKEATKEATKEGTKGVKKAWYKNPWVIGGGAAGIAGTGAYVIGRNRN